jgi:hypothetical protein
MTVRSPAEDDLVLAALGLEAPPSERRSAVVFAPGLRVSLVLDGSGRARAASGETARDRRLERFASEAGLDLDLVSDAVASDGEVAAAFGDALSLSLAQSSPRKR